MIEIGIHHLFAIDAHGDLGSLAADDEPIPFAERLGRIRAWRKCIIKRAVVVLAELLFAGGIHYLDFKPALHGIFGVGPEKDAAVAAR